MREVLAEGSRAREDAGKAVLDEDSEFARISEKGVVEGVTTSWDPQKGGQF